VGACRHGDRCSRQHNKPLFSQTVLLNHMYQAPNSTTVQTGPTSMGTAADDVPAQEHFDDFFEEVQPGKPKPIVFRLRYAPLNPKR
jgi:splicing factor U2AF subunit